MAAPANPLNFQVAKNLPAGSILATIDPHGITDDPSSSAFNDGEDGNNICNATYRAGIVASASDLGNGQHVFANVPASSPSLPGLINVENSSLMVAGTVDTLNLTATDYAREGRRRYGCLSGGRIAVLRGESK